MESYDPPFVVRAGLDSLDLQISDAQYLQYPDIVEFIEQEGRTRTV